LREENLKEESRQSRQVLMRSRLLFVVLSGFLRRQSGLEPISASFSLDAFRDLHTAGLKVLSSKFNTA